MKMNIREELENWETEGCFKQWAKIESCGFEVRITDNYKEACNWVSKMMMETLERGMDTNDYRVSFIEPKEALDFLKKTVAMLDGE